MKNHSHKPLNHIEMTINNIKVRKYCFQMRFKDLFLFK